MKNVSLEADVTQSRNARGCSGRVEPAIEAILGAVFVRVNMCNRRVARTMRLDREGGGERGISKFWPSSREVAIQAYVMHYTTRIERTTTNVRTETYELQI